MWGKLIGEGPMMSCSMNYIDVQRKGGGREEVCVCMGGLTLYNSNTSRRV